MEDLALDDRARARAPVLGQLLLGALTEAEAARQLGLSVRQARRLKAVYTRQGAAALVHGNRGRRPVHRLPDAVRARVVELASTRYASYDHQRLREALAEREQIVLTRSTLRRVLLEAGLRSPRRRRNLVLPPGVLPVSFDLARRRVGLLDLRGAEFRESFFHQTVERWRRERPGLLDVEVDFDTFAALARRYPGRVPDGLVFHIGRRGFMQLANLLSAPPEHLVVKESPAVNALLVGLLNAADETARAEQERLVAQALPFMFRPTRGSERWLIFQLSTWNIRLAETLLRLFPSTPAAFLYRSPTETVAAMVADPPGWQNLFGRPRALQVRYFPSLLVEPSEVPLSPVRFYAHAWRSAAEAALALPADRLLVMDYADVAASLEQALRRLMAHFRLPVGPAMLAALEAAQRPERAALSGDAAGPARRPTLEPEQEAEVLAVVGELPRRLAERRAAPAQQAHGEAQVAEGGQPGAAAPDAETAAGHGAATTDPAPAAPT